jgi:hypothetical protein
MRRQVQFQAVPDGIVVLTQFDGPDRHGAIVGSGDVLSPQQYPN